MMSYFRIHSVIQKIFILSSVPSTVLSVLDITLNLIQHNLTILIQTNECDSSKLDRAKPMSNSFFISLPTSILP